MITRPITRPITSPIARAVNAHSAIWNPRALFANGEQGVIYDPNDLTTLWQDAAGTIPVTAAGQPVGLMLDKSGRGNHAFQPTAASRPMLRQNATTGAYYLETDGSDDWMQTNAIDFTGTDKVSVFTGVRKLSDVAGGLVCELGVSAMTTDGAFALLAPRGTSGSDFSVISRGSVGVQISSGAIPAPVSAVFSASFNIAAAAAKRIVQRHNGAVIATSESLQGTGNYGNYPLYLFRRGGTSLPFSGHFYGLVIVGRLTTDAETRNVERLYANKTGVVLA